MDECTCGKVEVRELEEFIKEVEEVRKEVEEVSMEEEIR